MSSKSAIEISKLQFQTDIVDEYKFKHSADYRADREMNLTHFKEMMALFHKICNAETKQINCQDFLREFSGIIGEEAELEEMFMKIDVDADNHINWEDFSSFILLQSKGLKLMKEAKYIYR